MSFSDSEKLAWLRLIRTERIGPHTFHQLIRLYGSAEAAIDAVPTISARGGARKPLNIYPTAHAQAELERAQKAGVRLLASAENDYPTLLKHIPDSPPLIHTLGDASLLNNNTVAMVGARNASVGALKLTHTIANDLVTNYQRVVVSGLARGIDTAAHKGALAAN